MHFGSALKRRRKKTNLLFLHPSSIKTEDGKALSKSCGDIFKAPQ
jgi:hypothetical protein